MCHRCGQPVWMGDLDCHNIEPHQKAEDEDRLAYSGEVLHVDALPQPRKCLAAHYAHAAVSSFRLLSCLGLTRKENSGFRCWLSALVEYWACSRWHSRQVYFRTGRRHGFLPDQVKHIRNTQEGAIMSFRAKRSKSGDSQVHPVASRYASRPPTVDRVFAVSS